MLTILVGKLIMLFYNQNCSKVWQVMLPCENVIAIVYQKGYASK